MTLAERGCFYEEPISICHFSFNVTKLCINILNVFNMKRFTLFLLAALLMTATSMAQKPAARELSANRAAALMPGLKADAKKIPSKMALQQQADLERQHSARSLFASKKAMAEKASKNVDMQNPRMKAITGDEPYFPTQPEGTQQYYVRNGSAYYTFWGYVFNTDFSGSVGNVVFGNNDEVYIKNIVSQYPTDAWVKGTIKNGKITIEFPQVAMEYYGEYYYYEILSYDENEQWFLPSSNQTLTLNYNATTGAITCPANSSFAYGMDLVGLVDATEEWTGYGDWAFSLKPMNDEPVTAPEGLETERYAVTADGFDGALVNVGFQGNEVYVQGLYPGLPEAWVKGTIDGNKATFKNGQYIGADEFVGFFEYLVGAKGEEKYDDFYEEYYTEYTLTSEDIVFDYDAATKVFSNSNCFLVNAGTDDVNYAVAFDKAKMSPFVEVAATPANPEWISINEEGVSYYYDYGYGWGYMDFNICSKDVDGNFILPDKLSYQLYTKVNGEVSPLVLSADNYVNLDNDMDELPYSYTDDYDIDVNGNQHTIYYFVVGPEEYGIQAIYRGAGEERRSDIVWYEVSTLGSEIQPEAATPDYPDVDPSDVGSSITAGFFTGEEEATGFGDNLEQIYDVAIHLQNDALVGAHVESITIPLYSTEGISDIKGWLSSQLRVEDNQNVPDLVSVNVENAEAGMFTVKFDKPYTIPAEGFYAGYSFTVDDASSEENAKPIATISGANEGGLYLHSTRNMLKWLDVSEALDRSAAIQVTISGSAIKENAVAPLDGEQEFVEVNAPVETKFVVVNHGSEGIKSLDIDYSIVGGASGSQHIDLAKSVAGFFGEETEIALSLPAITEDGTYTLELNVSKVNGVANADVDPVANKKLVALGWLPKKRTVMEEYTGTWCQWCPRGFVAMEKLANLYDGEYVLLSYHNADPMEVVDSYSYPSSVGGFPDAWLDRSTEVDPYYGTSDFDDFHVATDMSQRNKLFGFGSVEFQSELSADGQAVNVTSQVSFPYDVEDGQFALEYVLVADGLTGGSDWDQANAYAGMTSETSPDLQEFVNAGSSVSGLVFNDVVIMSPECGSGVDGSVPTSMKANEVAEHSYSFLLANAVNTGGENLVQEQAKLKVAVLLLNTETGEIVNANVAPVGGSTVGINSATKQASSEVVSVRYFDLSGRRLTTPQHGINIVSVVYADGSVQTMKMKR